MSERGGDERELVRRCRDGSESAYVELVRAHRPRLYSLAYRLTNDAGMAEDVVQETFLAAFRQIDKVEPNPSLAPWLNTIAIRTARKTAGRRAALPTSPLHGPTRGDGSGALEDDPHSMDPTADPFEAAASAEIRREIAAAIGALPFKHRVAVVLRFVMGLEYAEAAATAGVPLNTFKSDLLRGTRTLRELLEARLSQDFDLSDQERAGRESRLAGGYIPPRGGAVPRGTDVRAVRHTAEVGPAPRAVAGIVGTDGRR